MITTDLVEAKKTSPESSGTEEVGDWLQLVRELEEAGEYDSTALARRGHLGRPLFWLVRAAAVTAGFGSLLALAGWKVAFWVTYLTLPLLFTLTMGAVRDQFLGERPLALLDQLRRWLPEVGRVLPLYLVLLTLVGIPMVALLGGPFPVPTRALNGALALAGSATWLWGCILVELVLGRRSRTVAVRVGMLRAVTALLLQPFHAMRMLATLGRHPARGHERLLWSFVLGVLWVGMGGFLVPYALLLPLELGLSLRLSPLAYEWTFALLLVFNQVLFMEMSGAVFVHDAMACLAADQGPSLPAEAQDGKLALSAASPPEGPLSPGPE